MERPLEDLWKDLWEDLWKTFGRRREASRRRAGRRWTGISGSFGRGFLGEDFWGKNFLRMEKNSWEIWKRFRESDGAEIRTEFRKQNQPREWGGDPDEKFS